MTDEARDSLLRKAYTNAMTRLREAHKDEFLGYQTEEAKKLGLDWSPRKSKADRARDQIAKLLDENPVLREELLTAARQQEAAEAKAEAGNIAGVIG